MAQHSGSNTSTTSSYAPVVCATPQPPRRAETYLQHRTASRVNKKVAMSCLDTAVLGVENGSQATILWMIAALR